MKLYIHMTHMYPYPVAKFSCRQRGLDERYKHLNTTLNIQFVKFPRGFRKRAPIYLEEVHQTFLSSPRTLESIWRGAKIWCNNSTKCRCYSWTTNRKPCHSEVIIEFLDLKNPQYIFYLDFIGLGKGEGRGRHLQPFVPKMDRWRDVTHFQHKQQQAVLI